MSWSLFIVSLVFQYLKGSSFLDRIVLEDGCRKEQGYSAVPTYEQYLGQVGVVVHPLRPSGVIELPTVNAWMSSPKGLMFRWKSKSHRGRRQENISAGRRVKLPDEKAFTLLTAGLCPV